MSATRGLGEVYMGAVPEAGPVTQEGINPTSTQNAVIEWNRVRHLKEPLFSRATIALWNKMTASLAEEHSRTWFELFLEILEHVPPHKRNRQAFEIIDNDFIRRVEKWPGVWSKALVLKAESLLEWGQKSEVLHLLGTLYVRPYLFTDSSIYLRAYYCYVFAKGRILDVRHARMFYHLVRKSGDNRTVTIASGQQVSILRYLCTVYRISHLQQMLKLAGDSTSGYVRYLFRGLEHDLYLRGGGRINPEKWYAAKRLERKRIQILLAKDHSGGSVNSVKSILVTRTQGGLGDIIMINYALQQLRRNKPSYRIVFAVPQLYLPWVAFFEGIVPRDIHDPALSLSDCEIWYNLSDCPAGHEESGSNRDRVSRIKAWCKALDVSYGAAIASPPRLKPGKEEIERAKSLLLNIRKTDRKIIALQWASADAYKDYPFMRELALHLAQAHHILILHSHPLSAADQNALESASVKLLIGLEPQQVLAVLSQVDLICGPDSSFIHIAGQLEKPGLLLAGPINGKLQTAGYPMIDFIDLREKLKCIPCWRNEAVHCVASGDFSSLCLHAMEIDVVVKSVESKLRGLRLK